MLKVLVSVNERDVVVDELYDSGVSAFCHEIENLHLDTGRVHSRPFHISSLQLGIRGRLCWFSDASDCGGAIDGFLGAGDIG